MKTVIFQRALSPTGFALIYYKISLFLCVLHVPHLTNFVPGLPQLYDTKHKLLRYVIHCFTVQFSFFLMSISRLKIRAMETEK